MSERMNRTSIEALIERYDALLFDAYGVLVHAEGAMPGARETIAALNATGKPYALITNDASKLPETASARYRRFGLDIGADCILSSGLLLEEYFSRHDLHGAACAVLGTADSEAYVQRAGGVVMSPDDAFDVLVVGDQNGFPFVEAVDAAMSSLFRATDAGGTVRLVLPNPDLIFPHGTDGFGIAAGSIALIFEAALRRRYPDRDDLVFDRLGKPQPHLYEAAIARLATRNVVMIGDQLETDIAGAAACGIDSVLVATGVSNFSLARPDAAIQPTHWMPSLMSG